MKWQLKASFIWMFLAACFVSACPFMGMKGDIAIYTQVGLGCSMMVACCWSFWMSWKFSEKTIELKHALLAEAEYVVRSSQEVEKLSAKLSESTNQQAASLQETVASLDEISAMVSRNADSAQSSASIAEQSKKCAGTGKSNTETMLRSIDSIAQGNDDIVAQMQKSNSEMSEIVKVIQQIGTKTQVINDIVFQTKLLSFNASVEAARAGDHGKGFAVVAEEVGNLASMSGKASKEISDLLSQSVHTVTSTVDKTKSLMDHLMRQSRDKVNAGTVTAQECAKSLDEILVNVSSVNDMVKEIANASQEQSTGIGEINRAMSEMDQVTQSNATIAVESLKSASELQVRAKRMQNILGGKISGPSEIASVAPRKTDTRPSQPAMKSNVVSINKNVVKAPVKAKEQMPTQKKVSGLDYSVPSKNDPRFEDA
jgi:methyl-accepting chemotaxis protein